MKVHGRSSLWFDDGSPVRAASAIAPFGSGWLIAQDDATHAAWWQADVVTRLRLFPPVDGHDLFAEEDGTKRLKPDLEAAWAIDAGSTSGVLLLGSGSLPNRTRVALVTEGPTQPRVTVADLTSLYDDVARALGVPRARRNLEGACVVDDRLRLFQRGDRRRGVLDASIDVGLAALLAAVSGDGDPAEVPVGDVRRYDLGPLGGRDANADSVPLAITDAVALTVVPCWSRQSRRTLRTRSRTVRSPPRRSRSSRVRKWSRGRVCLRSRAAPSRRSKGSRS